MYSARVLVLLALLVEFVNSFSWDIVVGEEKQLHFYYNGTLTHTENVSSANYITSIVYDPVHYRVLFADFNDPNMSISSFDLSTREIQPLITRKSNSFNHQRVAYDPVTQLLFWKESERIYSFSLNPASSNKAFDGNVLFTLDHVCYDIAVDSCGGYIYWVTDYNIERARFDGSEREVLIDSHVYYRLSLAIDQQTQKIYWTDTKYVNGNYQLSIESANFNGKNRTTFHIIVKNFTLGNSLTVSKDYIYWKNYNQVGIWQLPKYQSQHLEGKIFSKSSPDRVGCHRISANYTIKEQIQGIKSCEALTSLIPNNSKSESPVSICQNYCFQGDCSVSAEGQPTCSCKAGYSGKRCEVNACHKHCMNSGVCYLNEDNEPVCQCTAYYGGQRCDVSICKDYCFQGNCTVSSELQPYCRCDAGYSGERCEVNSCYKHCLNNGVCVLNEEDEPFCECTCDYKGVRCDVATTHTGVHADKTMLQVLQYLHSEVKQVTLIREELQRTLQFYLEKIDENAAKIKKCEKSMSDDLQNHDDIISKMSTSNTEKNLIT